MIRVIVFDPNSCRCRFYDVVV
ncbi:MAG: hypothetical protein DCF12_03760 [Snowella sp.]|nr:MAG: hypothetical protein DCF12_03760 [Snowella sp.]